MVWVVVLIIIFIIPEDTLECMLGAILGCGYGILMIVAGIAILYGVYKFFSDLLNGRQDGKYHLIWIIPIRQKLMNQNQSEYKLIQVTRTLMENSRVSFLIQIFTT